MIYSTLRNPFRILCAERLSFSAGFPILLFTLDAVNDLIRFFFALQIDPETVFLADYYSKNADGDAEYCIRQLLMR